MKKGQILLGLVLSMGIVFSAQASDSRDKAYFSSVMTILRTHIDTLLYLTNTPSKHSDNVVRHAIAINQTMGLFDHMDWTPARLAKLNLINGDIHTKAEEFNLYAKEARKNSKKLIRASKKWLVDGKQPQFVEAINKLSTSCNQCHLQLKDKQAPTLMTYNME
ncbi:MAG: cytochrome c [Magnetococcales bacterium]|nr:cytochrome c [Magnetococcales bacterium]